MGALGIKRVMGIKGVRNLFYTWEVEALRSGRLSEINFFGQGLARGPPVIAGNIASR